jgi:beta-1,4-N-acetylglucosaminyltransferase
MSLVFVTVGSTRFDALIEKINAPEFIKLLNAQGFGKIVIQHGDSPISNKLSQVEYFDYKSSISEFIDSASLIISHAGAGTSLEALRADKKLIVVPNESLLDNHQLELANKLAEEGYCLKASCSELGDALKKIPNFLPKKLPLPDKQVLNSIFS